MSSCDLLAIGNAIMDIFTQVDENFLKQHAIPKGTMQLITEEQAQQFYKAMQAPLQVCGGSAANTAVAFAGLGGKAAYIGKVADDALGHLYKQDLLDQGVLYRTPPLENGLATARSFVFNTADGERSMSTYLGACRHFSQQDLDEACLEEAKLLYFEGYLWDLPQAQEALLHAMHYVRKGKKKVAFSLSDPFCVQRYQSDFRHFLERGLVDLLFANEQEICALYEEPVLEKCVERLQKEGLALAHITRAEKGSVVIERGQCFSIEGYPVIRVIDATGAGDFYAAGGLYGHLAGWDGAHSAKLGHFLASLIIQQQGCRFAGALKKAVEDAGLLCA